MHTSHIKIFIFVLIATLSTGCGNRDFESIISSPKDATDELAETDTTGNNPDESGIDTVEDDSSSSDIYKKYRTN